VIIRFVRLTLIVAITSMASSEALLADNWLIGYWKLQGDCLDYSGAGNDGRNHHVDLAAGEFSGLDSYIEVPDSESLDLGTGDFTISAWVYTTEGVEDVLGDLVTKFDPSLRKGFNLTLNASNPGYNAQSDVRHVFFGTDNGTPGSWSDCGRPSQKTHISDALTVYDGDLYAGTTDGTNEADWAHVFRYQGGKTWEDLGRLGDGRTRGVYAMVVHDGALYAATSSSHGGQPPEMSYGRVYRFRGNHDWEDIGQPGKNYRLNALASYRGKLYVAAFNIGDPAGYVYVHEGGGQWRKCGEFQGAPHAMAVHDGRLFAAYPQGEVHAYDGSVWENLGNPLGSFDECNQIHSLGVYGGELHIGSWPKGKVAAWRDSEWVDLGRLGDATEVVSLTTYNGALYAGSIPRAEVFRLDAGQSWTSLRRLFDFPGYDPVPVGSGAKEVEDWTRASSLAVFQGKLFSSTATCYRTMLASPRPNETRGQVYAFSAGTCVSRDEDMGSGWKHVGAVRRGRTMELFVNGRLTASSQSDGDPLDVSNDASMLIGFGPQSHFQGKLRDVRLHNVALNADELRGLYDAYNPRDPSAFKVAREELGATSRPLPVDTQHP
jgi:hypothetical protein